MKLIMIMFSISLLTMPAVHSQGYNVGDAASDFKLKNVDGKFVSLANYPEAKGFIVIFTCNHCPYAKAYQDRIIGLDKKYKPLGYPVIAISPNDPELVPEDSYENMVLLAKEKGFTFPYLFDGTQEVYRQYGAKRTPHVYLLQKKEGKLMVQYIGAIDDNYEDATLVKTPYLANAVDALLAGKTPDPTFTKAIGCSIKDKMVQ
jgi:peroxiredoxin